ncbi:hypothetical protein [Streptomyces sp. NBC_01264]|uniref:hypothetical protein n=1 Tax=Streptomyces sp. NBC_01264 TaxID=2903804 RepID=UPI002258B116|nr:hypothetical protein [Streptomyces sp. NBC_01264]MCX4782733.1 hypothetical protein [Streptomyces sp. NBC_01264]
MIAENAHCHYASVSRILRARQRPSWHVLEPLTDYLRSEYKKRNGDSVGDFPSREVWYQMYVDVMVEVERRPEVIRDEKDKRGEAGGGAPTGMPNASSRAGASVAGRSDARTARAGRGTGARQAWMVAMTGVPAVLSALLGHASWMEAMRNWCVMLAAAEAISLLGRAHRISYVNLAVDLRPLPLSVRLVGRLLMITMLTWPADEEQLRFLEGSLADLMVMREQSALLMWRCAAGTLWSSLVIAFELRLRR